MGTTRQPQTAARERRRILAAATELFAVHGYRATTLQQLLDAARVDLAVFEAHFDGTEDCLLAAYEDALAAATEQVAAALPSGAGWPERTAIALEAVFELVEAHPAEAHVVLVDTQLASPAATDRYLATIESLAPFLREGRAISTLRYQLPPSLESILLGGIAFMLRCALIRGERVRHLYPEALRFLLLPYLGESEATDFIAARRPVESGPGPAGPQA
jgi:AcrR family transcriptional regulator